MPIRTIIAALSLEADSKPVADRAMQLAAQHGARLVLVHVIEGISDTAAWAATDAALPLPALQQEALDRIRQQISASGLQDVVNIIVEAGAPHVIIHQLAEREQTDLLVIGPGKPQTLRERLFGSTADRLVRLTPCPILIVRNANPARYERISVAVDFSALSEAAFRAAVEVGQDAAIDVVHIVDIPLQFEQAMLKAGAPQSEIASYRRAKAGAAHKQLEDFVAGQHELSRSVRMHIAYGAPADSLVTLSADGGTDLLALGLQGQNIIARTLLGSVAQRVLQAASCDILAVGAEALP